MKTINLTQAIICLNNAIYQPLTQFQNESELNLLFELRKKLIAISKEAQIKLTVKVEAKFDQEKITNEQIAQIKNVNSATLKSLKDAVDYLKQETEKIEHSEVYKTCITDLISLLTKTIELLKKNKIDDIKIIENYFKKSEIYKLCQQNGALYIPISQGMDPLLGGFEKDGKLEISNGECSGKVISWIEACSNSTSIKYPFYAGDHHKIIQEGQKNFKNHYKPHYYNPDLIDFANNVVSELKPNCLYYISLSDGEAGHCLGLRIRQDGILELFDPNYFHIFCCDKSVMTNILRTLLIEYHLDFGLESAVLFEADVLQYNSDHNIFPHKLHVIQAANKPVNLSDEKVFFNNIQNVYRTCARKFKQDKQQQVKLFNLFLKNIQHICESINYSQTLDEIIASIKTMPVDSFLFNDTNKNIILSVIEQRRLLIEAKDFQRNFKERQDAIKELIKVEQDVANQLNQLRDEIENQKDHLGSISKEQCSKFSDLSQKSMKIWHVFHKVKMSNVVHIGNIDAKFDKKYSSSQKYIQLSMVAQNIIMILKVMEKNIIGSIDANSESEKKIVRVYEKLVQVKLKSIQTNVGLVLNNILLSEDIAKCELELRDLLHFSPEQFSLLEDQKNDFSSIEHHLKELACSKISESEVREEVDLISENNNGLQNDINILLASIQKMINYIEQVKEEYISSIDPNKLYERSPRSLIMRAKIVNRINSYSERIKSLIHLKNTIIRQCHAKEGNKLFIELASQVRQGYSELFPVDFSLIDNYMPILDRLIERNKTLILNEEEKANLQCLTNSWNLLHWAIDQLDKEIKNLKRGIKDLASSPHNFFSLEIQSIKRREAAFCIEVFSFYKVLCHSLLENAKDFKEIITFVNNSLNNFVKEDRSFNFNALLKVNSNFSSQLIKLSSQ